MVKVNSTDETPEVIKRIPANLHIAEEYKDKLVSEPINIGGIHFLVYRTVLTGDKILGASLNRFKHPF